MKQLYDQIDQYGNIIASGILLVPGLTLPEGHEWVKHTPSIESLRAEKRIEVEQHRNNVCFKPVSVIGYLWQADQRSQDLLSSAIMLAQIGAAPTPSTWRTLDNQDISVTLDNLKAIAAAIALQTQGAYQHSWDLKQLILQATTQEELDQVIWSYYGS